MTQYLLSVHTAASPEPEPINEEAARSFEQIGRLEEEMRAAGALLFSGRLTEPNTATVVDASNGRVVTTDGPFLEAKEQVGGFYIIEAEDLDAALAWASRTSAIIRMPIEVRPFWGLKQG